MVNIKGDKTIKTEDAANCPRCGKTGAVVDSGVDGYGLIWMDCEKCFRKWRAMSKVCPDCGKYTGFPGEGLCSECYGIKRLR